MNGTSFDSHADWEYDYREHRVGTTDVRWSVVLTGIFLLGLVLA